MTNREKLLSSFEEKYNKEKKHPFYKPKHREFLYDCIKYWIYNTELVLCINWLKPVSRFVADKIEHIDFLKRYLKKMWLELESRELKKMENDINVNNRINHIIYIWKDIELLKNAIDYDFNYTWDIWGLLWYPECCSTKWTFKQNKKDLRKYKNDTNKYFKDYLSLDNLPLLNNPFFNFTANSLSFYYPCKLDCEESLIIHQKYAEVIEKDNPDFYRSIISYFSLPILFLFPEKNNVLTFPFHFDEVFRIYFIWVQKWDIIYYKDFFILSYAFLDQTIDEEYKIESFKLLEKLLYWNMCYIKDNYIVIEGINYKETYEIKEYAKIVKFI